MCLIIYENFSTQNEVWSNYEVRLIFKASDDD